MVRRIVSRAVENIYVKCHDKNRQLDDRRVMPLDR